MILLGVAPCTAMVFVWSNLVKGNSNYTLVQVIINDLILLFAFAPIASFLLGINHIKIPLWTIFNSVLIYVFIPLLFCLLLKKIVNNFQRRFRPELINGKIDRECVQIVKTLI